MRPIAGIFLPWWGPAPGWECHFLARAASIDSLRPILVGDAATWVSGMDAIRIPCTMDEFEARASEVSGVQIQKHDPKYSRGQLLCELRPLMGEMYADVIDGFPWWGYGDWDVVWGDWDGFLNDGILSQFDAISTNGKTVNGPLQLMRNTWQMRQLCLDGIDILQSPLGAAHLDEAGLDRLMRSAADAGRLRCLYPAGLNGHDRHPMWNRCCLKHGKLYRMNQAGVVGSEILKFHFPGQKRWPVVEG